MKRLAVLGHPVAHSRSPAMQNAALKAIGLDVEWIYEPPIDVEPEQFEAKVREMAAGEFVGANVTIPHKEAALRLADERTPAADGIGAANTLSFRDGKIHADNTDGRGFLNALPESPARQRALVLGAGGAARAVVWTLLREGAEVDVWNRTAARAEQLCEELGGNSVAAPDLRNYALLVNSTSVGLHGEDPFAELPVEAGHLEDRHTVVDLVYGAGPTKLVAIAAQVGARRVDGIDILVHQGALSFEIWAGQKPPADVMDIAARR